MPEPQPGKPANAEPKPGEPASKSDDDKIKDVDPDAEILSGTQDLLERYKQQIGGITKGFQDFGKRLDKIDETIAGISQKPQSPSDAPTSDDDKPYVDYYKKLGFVAKEDVEKMFQERLAPLQEGQKATQKAEQQQVLNEFIKEHPEFSKEEDPAGEKMTQIIEKLRRIAPVVPNNPNYSLKEDLELAYNWAFGKSELEEFRQKAKAAGASAALEALETQVGGGSSISAPKETKSRTPEQEAILKEWGVDDETLSKKKYPTTG